MIRGIKFISIPITDQDVALKFYTESLGMKVVTDQPFTGTQRWIELKVPGADTGISLFTPPGHENRRACHGVDPQFSADQACACARSTSGPFRLCAHLEGGFADLAFSHWTFATNRADGTRV